MPAGDKKYLLVEKRRLIFTSSSVAVPLCCFSTTDDRWYNVPRRPLTGLKPLPPLLLTVASSYDTNFAGTDILKKCIGKDTVMTRLCLPELAVSMRLRCWLSVCVYGAGGQYVSTMLAVSTRLRRWRSVCVYDLTLFVSAFTTF